MNKKTTITFKKLKKLVFESIDSKQKLKPGIFNGYFIYTNCDEGQKIWTKRIKIDGSVQEKC